MDLLQPVLGGGEGQQQGLVCDQWGWAFECYRPKRGFELLLRLGLGLWARAGD